MDISTQGERLKIFRKHKKISGEELGEIFSLSKQGISHLESDRTKMTAVQLEALINKFPDLNIYWLVAGQGEMIIEGNYLEAKNCWKLLELERAKSDTFLSMLKENGIKVE